MKRFDGEVFRCRVYPKKGSLYYVALIFRNRKSLRAAYRQIGHGPKDTKRTNGACCPVYQTSYKTGKAKTSPLLGYVLFSKYALTPGICAHEFLHAAIAYFWRIKRSDLLDLSCDRTSVMPKGEEPLCYAVTRMVDEFDCRVQHQIKYHGGI